ncbi:MAG: hypothetical protein HYS39_00225 [Proteobacteria bacterium]|nr:hypothetical protein [Pseudomonadota bacterium]
MTISKINSGTQTMYLSPVDSTERQVSDLQKAVDRASHETGTAGRNEYYCDISNARLYLNHENDLTKIQSYLSDIVFVRSRQNVIRETISVVKRMAEELNTRLQDQISDRAVKDDGFQITVEQMRSLLTNYLRKQFNGEYIFSGQANQTDPVIDLSSMPSVPSGSSPDFTYYKGSAAPIIEYIDDNEKLAFSLTAGHPALEKLIRSLNLSFGADASPQGKARISEALSLSSEAYTEIGELEQYIGQNIQEIDNVVDNFKITEKRLSEDIKTMGFRDQLQAWMDYFQIKGHLEIIRTHWIETVKSTNQLIQSIRLN